MPHSIPHKWSKKTRKLDFKNEMCIGCHRSLTLLSTNLQCKAKNCGQKVHEECIDKVKNNCGLTVEHFKFFWMKIHTVQGSKSQRNGVSSKIWPEPNTTTLDEEDLDATDMPISVPTNLSATNDSDTTLKSLVLEEKVSSKRLLFDGIELPEFEGIGCYRGKFHTTSIKTNDEVDVKEFIGRGRFGEVRRGQFHEEIVIKFLNMDHVEEAGRGKALYNDTTSFRETRHPNIALFKGYMIDKNIYALIIQDCKDCSLHRLIHGDPSNDSRMKSNSLEYSQTLSFAQQICLGMQYLKARNIIHKDLRTKNIFVDGKKIIITDYGLFNMARLQYPKRNHGYLVSENWTTYLAPELIRSLNSTFSPLPFSYKTDIYSFGTCLYEMFFRKFPFENEAWERRIFFIGRGVKASFKGFNVNRVLTGIITKCWDINPEVRNEFEEIHKKLNDVPKKHVTRSPSFPSPKSYESIF
uniref:Protein kinase domain-containing protein n=1 Tax=Rhabditophanes sp. KR3021 TaxID=114890 RepID=A0AC35TR88_9BILA